MDDRTLRQGKGESFGEAVTEAHMRLYRHKMAEVRQDEPVYRITSVSVTDELEPVKWTDKHRD